MELFADLLVISFLGLSFSMGPVLGFSCNNCQTCAIAGFGNVTGCFCHNRQLAEYVGGNLNNGTAYLKPDWESCRTSCEFDYPTARFYSIIVDQCWCKSSDAVPRFQFLMPILSGDLNTCPNVTTSAITPTTTTTTSSTTTEPKSKSAFHRIIWNLSIL